MKVSGAQKISYHKPETYKFYICMPWDVTQKAKYFVDKVASECHWYHTVRKEIDNEKKRVVYFLDHLFIPQQKVSGAQVETDPNAFAYLGSEIKKKFDRDPEKYNPVLAAMTCWVHSHVNMGTSPSGQDDTQFKQMITEGIKHNPDQPQLMMIWNKRDEAFTRVYDPEFNGIIIENIPIVVQEPMHLDFSYIDESIENKLVKSEAIINLGNGVYSTNTTGRHKSDSTNNSVATYYLNQVEEDKKKADSARAPSKQARAAFLQEAEESLTGFIKSNGFLQKWLKETFREEDILLLVDHYAFSKQHLFDFADTNGTFDSIGMMYVLLDNKAYPSTSAKLAALCGKNPAYWRAHYLDFKEKSERIIKDAYWNRNRILAAYAFSELMSEKGRKTNLDALLKSYELLVARAE